MTISIDSQQLASVTGGASCSLAQTATGALRGVANAVAGSTRKLIAGTQFSKQTLPEYEASLRRIEYPVPACRPW